MTFQDPTRKLIVLFVTGLKSRVAFVGCLMQGLMGSGAVPLQLLSTFLAALAGMHQALFCVFHLLSLPFLVVIVPRTGLALMFFVFCLCLFPISLDFVCF